VALPYGFTLHWYMWAAAVAQLGMKAGLGHGAVDFAGSGSFYRDGESSPWSRLGMHRPPRAKYINGKPRHSGHHGPWCVFRPFVLASAGGFNAGFHPVVTDRDCHGGSGTPCWRAWRRRSPLCHYSGRWDQDDHYDAVQWQLWGRTRLDHSRLVPLSILISRSLLGDCRRACVAESGSSGTRCNRRFRRRCVGALSQWPVGRHLGGLILQRSPVEAGAALIVPNESTVLLGRVRRPVLR